MQNDSKKILEIFQDEKTFSRARHKRLKIRQKFLKAVKKFTILGSFQKIHIKVQEMITKL